jgi:hypothetical protein
MERQSRSNLIKLLFADDASIVSSTNSEDTAYQNQSQSQDDQHGSQAMDIIEDDIVQNEESEAVAETQSKKGKRRINEVYEHQSIIGDEMPTDSSKSTRRSSRSRKSVDAFVLSDINSRKSNHKAQVDVSDNRGDSIVPKRKPRSDDTREKIIKSPVSNEYTCLYYAMYNSLRTEKHRMAFSKGNLQHPSKAFVDFMINEHTSPKVIERILKEGYTADDMHKYLFHLKDNGWIKEFQWQKQYKWSLSNFFCSGSVTPQNLILFANSLTSDMKERAKLRMQKVKKDYEKNKKKYKAEGKRLCELQHIEFLKFYDVFQKETDKNEFHPHGGALQRDDKGKTYYFDSGKEYVMYEPTIEKLYFLLTQIYKSMRFQIVCDGEDVNFVVHKGRKRVRKDKISIEESSP